MEEDIKILEELKEAYIFNLSGFLGMTREEQKRKAYAIENLIKEYKRLKEENTYLKTHILTPTTIKLNYIPKYKVENLITQIESAIEFMKTDKTKIKVVLSEQKEKDLRLEIMHLKKIMEDK